MKNTDKMPFVLAIGIFWGTLLAQGQSAFSNLDFSAAQIPPNTPNGSSVPAGEALPGWTAYFGNSQVATVGYNMVFPDEGGVFLVGTGGNIFLPPGTSYTAVMQAGFNSSGLVSASIAQTGFIPVTAMSLVFMANFNAGEWAVTIDGQNIPVMQQGIIGSYVMYAGNVSAYAGKTEDLRFIALAGQQVSGQLNLANISFSPNAVPEPGTCALLLSGAVLFGLARRRRLF